MTNQLNVNAINRSMSALRYSLASYLRFARPWVDSSMRSVADVIRCLAESHAQNVVRIGELLAKRHGYVESCTFPSAFTGLNDLSLEYLLPLVIKNEKCIIRIIEASALALECDTEAFDLMTKIVESEKRHLKALISTSGRRDAPGFDSIVAARQLTAPRRSTNESLLGRNSQITPGILEVVAS